MIKMYTAEELNTWKKCRKLYEYKYIHKLYIPEELHKYDVGLSVHKLLDYHAKGLNVEPMLQHTSQEIRHIWNIIQNSIIAQQKIVRSEFTFQCKIPNINRWISGRIDRLIQLDQGIYQIIDWKTGQEIHKNPQENWQTLLYLYGVTEIATDLQLDITPDKLSFLYFKASSPPEALKINYSRQQHLQLKDRITETILEIEANTHWDRLNPCKNFYCNYMNICKPVTTGG